MGKVIDTVTALAAPIAQKHGCEIWEIEFIKESGVWYLRLYIDHPDGVSISHCEVISRDLDPILDEHEHLIPESYTFEVSSAGAERRLRNPADYERFAGSLAEVKLYQSKNGQKVFKGHIIGRADNGIELDISGQPFKFEKSEIASVRLRVF